MYQCTIVTVLEALGESWGFPQKYIRRKATLHQRKKHGHLIATPIASTIRRSPNFALLLNLKHILRSRKLGSCNSSIPSYFPINFRTSVLHFFLFVFRLLQILLAFPVGWLADLYGTAFITLAGAMVQTVAGLPFFLALESDPTSVTNLFVTGILFI